MTDHARRPYAVRVSLGALAAPLAEQLGVESSHALDHLQQDADAIVRLKIRGLLTEAEANAASKRLMKRISKEVLNA